MDKLTTSRRSLVKMVGCTALGAAVASPFTIGKPELAIAQSELVETPYFQERVDSGELPPIAERLPKEPFVVGPGVLIQEEFMTWEDGKPGGTLRLSGTHPNILMMVGFGATILRSPSQSTGTSLPNVLSAFEPNDDYTVFKCTIREGLRWSDGEPVTTEDVRFAWEDVYGYEELSRSWPAELHTHADASKPTAELAIEDDYTFTLTFAESYGYFVAYLNSWIPGYDFMIKPAHYLQKFHAEYADEAELAKLVEDENQSSWANLFNAKDVSHWGAGDLHAVGLPTLNAWVVSEASENRRVFERNPYYWHVDSKGQQLPYIDQLVTNIVVDFDAITNSVIAGEVDMASGAEVSLSKMPVYQQNAERGGYRTFMSGSFNNPVMIYLNRDFGLNEEGNVWQQLMADPEYKFSRAFAAAMDPAEVNKAVYFGVYGEPFLNNLERDVDTANQLLDELGMTMDGDYRVGPDGQPFLIELANPGESADFTPVAELVREQLAGVGLRVDINNLSYELFEQRKTNNELTASMHWNDGPGWPSGISEDYLPNHKGPWSPETWKYFSTNGESGIEPGETMKEFYAIHSERKTVPPESEEGKELWSRMETWFLENYPFIPTTGKRTSVNLVSNKLKNVPNEGAPFEQDTYICAEGSWFEE